MIDRSPWYATNQRRWAILPLVLLTAWTPAAAQTTTRSARSSSTLVQTHTHTTRAWATNIVIPQSRAFEVRRPGHPQGTVQISEVDVKIAIVEQVATTTLEIALHNPTRSILEAELVVPVPKSSVVRGFDFQGSGSEPTAVLLPRDEARRTYDSIVAQVRDPALLEFIDYHLIRSSVFPVPAGGTQKVRLTYESLLAADGNRIDYLLPRTESLDYTVPWNIEVTLKSKRPIATVFSPSHAVETHPGKSNHTVSVKIASNARTEPGSFRLSYLLRDGDLTASLLAYPESKGGYFLLLAGLPPRTSTEGQPSIRREVTLVLDRSGSMNGEKLEQVREAALQIIAGLEDGEAFNVILYNESVEKFAPQPLHKNSKTEAAARLYLNSAKARGGTNIHDALLEALRPRPQDDTLPMVLFLTDGRPTTGQTAEKAIRALATEGNRFNRRIFTLGVGVDVNSPMLENMAFQSRGSATFVLPGEDIELQVASLFRKLSGPVLATPQLSVVDDKGQPAIGRVHDMLPSQLPDMFDGDQLVVMGQYVGAGPMNFQLAGDFLGSARSFQFEFDLAKATTRNAFVPRLWAGRKIGVLIDAIRSSGAEPRTNATDPKHQELIDEIVRLSTEFGILTEYTAFLAREGTDLSERAEVLSAASSNFHGRAVQTRAGQGSVNQEINNITLKGQTYLNARNWHVDANLNRVDVSNVRQVADQAFYRKANTWIDSRLVDKPENETQPGRVIEFGSDEFLTLARRLAREGRQGSVAFHQDTLLLVDGQRVLVKAPESE